MEKHTDTAAPMTGPDKLTTDQLVRGADRNPSDRVAGQTESRGEAQVLPSVDPGITLLDIEGDQGVPVVHSLVLDALLVADGPAFWVDANGYATTTSLARLAPSKRLLDRTHVARVFTAYQHYGAVSSLQDGVKRSIQAATTTEQDTHSTYDGDTNGTPSMLIVPAIDAPYQTEDALGETHAETLLTRALVGLAAIADAYNIPVLVTRTTSGAQTPAARAADHHLTCEYTRMGPRFISEDFETLVYPVDGGQQYQTTFAYWRQVLGTRARQAGVTTDSPPQSSGSETARVGTGVTAAGDRTAVTIRCAICGPPPPQQHRGTSNGSDEPDVPGYATID
jgi:hypothetical protein